MTAAYSEIDEHASEWLANLVEDGLVAPGENLGDISGIEPSQLEGVDQFHAFAGLGVWSMAMRNAGWPDDAPAWTGSCPCQPFSGAKRWAPGDKFDDRRHLWPAWHRLISERLPLVVLGEQVASSDGLEWFDAASADLEGSGYAVGASVLAAAGFGAPHARERLYFVAVRVDHESGRPLRALADRLATARRSRAGSVGDAGRDGTRQHARELRRDEGEHAERGAHGDHAPVDPGPSGARPAGFWSGAEWVRCRDRRRRPVEAGTHPLAHGPAVGDRAGRALRKAELRAYGNAIVEPVAREFAASVIDLLTDGF